MTKPKPRLSPTALLEQARDSLRVQLERLGTEIAERAEALEALLAERAQAEHELACAERALAPALPAGVRLLPPDRPVAAVPAADPVEAAIEAVDWDAQAEQLFGAVPVERDPVFDD